MTGTGRVWVALSEPLGFTCPLFWMTSSLQRPLSAYGPDQLPAAPTPGRVSYVYGQLRGLPRPDAAHWTHGTAFLT